VFELVAGILLATGAVYFVLRPILYPEIGGRGTGDEGRGDEGEDPEDDLSPRAVALRALKEIEFDRATGKLSDADYDALKAKYTAEALAALRSEPREQGVGSRAQTSHPAPRSPLPAPACPTHGPRPEPDAAFCSECGRRLATAPGYCARCGTALEHEAHYCHSCGARVAA
jgi:double zinc ribbon protein